MNEVLRCVCFKVGPTLIVDEVVVAIEDLDHCEGETDVDSGGSCH